MPQMLGLDGTRYINYNRSPGRAHSDRNDHPTSTPRPHREHLSDHRYRLPNLGVKDAFVLDQACGHTDRDYFGCHRLDRLHQHVNGYRVEVVEPLRKLRGVLDKPKCGLVISPGEDPVRRRPGTAASCAPATVTGCWLPYGHLEQPHRRRRRTDRRRWLGNQDRSWGTAGGEPEPAGRPPTLRACGGCMCRWPSATPSC